MEKHFLSADEYLRDQWRLAAAIRTSGWKPDFVVGLWRGGAPVAVAVHEFLRYTGWDAKHLPLKCASYTSLGCNEGEVVFTLAEETFAFFKSGDKVLFVDDVFDTGKTAAAVFKRLEGTLVDAKIACVYSKAVKNTTNITPDFVVKDVGSDWLVFPHEMEDLPLSEIAIKDPLLAELAEKFA
jgi:hypoxanthine phosphoribosyltransferase